MSNKMNINSVDDMYMVNDNYANFESILNLNDGDIINDSLKLIIKKDTSNLTDPKDIYLAAKIIGISDGLTFVQQEKMIQFVIEKGIDLQYSILKGINKTIIEKYFVDLLKISDLRLYRIVPNLFSTQLIIDRCNSGHKLYSFMPNFKEIITRPENTDEEIDQIIKILIKTESFDILNDTDVKYLNKMSIETVQELIDTLKQFRLTTFKTNVLLKLLGILTLENNTNNVADYIISQANYLTRFNLLFLNYVNIESGTFTSDINTAIVDTTWYNIENHEVELEIATRRCDKSFLKSLGIEILRCEYEIEAEHRRFASTCGVDFIYYETDKYPDIGRVPIKSILAFKNTDDEWRFNIGCQRDISKEYLLARIHHCDNADMYEDELLNDEDYSHRQIYLDFLKHF